VLLLEPSSAHPPQPGNCSWLMAFIGGLCARGVGGWFREGCDQRSLQPVLRDVLNLGVIGCCHQSLGSSYRIRYSPMTGRSSISSERFDAPLPVAHFSCGSQSAVVAIRIAYSRNSASHFVALISGILFASLALMILNEKLTS